MQAILVFSHGSVLCGAERNLVELVGRLRARGDAPIVELGFLNYNEPSFADAVNQCVRQGATRIVIAPYFLISGKFVVVDLPRVIAEEQAKHPSIEFVTADVIGFHPTLADTILASATTARPTSEWRAAMESGDWCRNNPKCPLHGSELCRAHVEAHV